MPDDSLPNPPPPEQSGGQGELCASLESLKVGGVAPSEGDSVSCKVEGTLSRIEGDSAYIEPAKVNGQDIPSDMDDQEESPDSEKSMLDMAAKADQGGY